MNDTVGSSTPDLDGISRKDFDLSAPLTKPTALGLGNLTVVEIDPGGIEATIRWEAFNKRSGSAINVPYEVITLSAGTERYVITDRSVGNNALSVNETIHRLEPSQRLHIKPGQGVSIVGGYRTHPFPGHYADSTKFSQCHYLSLNGRKEDLDCQQPRKGA